VVKRPEAREGSRLVRVQFPHLSLQGEPVHCPDVASEEVPPNSDAPWSWSYFQL
jgi:hypothetical protein